MHIRLFDINLLSLVGVAQGSLEVNCFHVFIVSLYHLSVGKIVKFFTFLYFQNLIHFNAKHFTHEYNLIAHDIRSLVDCNFV